MKKPGIADYIITILLYVIEFLILVVCVGILWNWLMPTIFNLPTITQLQAAGIFALCNILFKPLNNSKEG